MLDFKRDNNIIYTIPYYNCMMFRANKQSTPFSELKNDLDNVWYNNLLSSICNGSLIIRSDEYEYRPYHDMSYYQRDIIPISYRACFNKSMCSTQIRGWDDAAPEEVIGRMNDMVECIVGGR